MPRRSLIPGLGLIYSLYTRRLKGQVDGKNHPKHIGLILDGNRRWAKQRAMESSSHGHRAGADKIHEFLTWCDDLGVDVVTLYLLSTDNINGRDKVELDALCDIIESLADQLSRFRNWRVQHVGHRDDLPAGLLGQLDAAAARTENNSGLHVNLAVGYGGRQEITQAVRRLVDAHHKSGGDLEGLAETVSVESITQHLYTGGQPDLDLVIRTSGEQRLSDFMIWQAAHSEFYFVEALGPDLREVDFLRAMRDYGRRARRFGH
ncbi:isoprenyl transferase [Pontimonas sp.]|uniref:isoprenyl transferase n=1 Tax=Pontimonas sp. TaxID=2304492 RepID=UPI00287047A7|nr:isoprenyl transferase [Pontimonas sp.]MDR9396228.1 isoprenyl transferase [Pontimonas sp.]MDR9434687.1 isoprenyl transferase [Pontimonas sp.]